MSVKKRDNLSISPWIRRFSGLLPEEGSVLDLAAGGGRHSRWLLNRGHRVTALDRQTDVLLDLQKTDSNAAERLEVITADLEDGSPWPLSSRRFDAVIVVNYLWRPLFPSILESIEEGGLLLYDTFAVGHEAFGRPTNPDFLLKPGELLDMVAGRLTVIAYEHGRIDGPSGPAVKQRITACGAGPVTLIPS